MRVALLVLLVASTGVGCAELLGGCGPTLTAQWREPGLFEGLPGAARQVGLVVERTDPSGGIPLQHPALRDRWRAFALETVVWGPEGLDREADRVSLSATQVHVTIPGSDDPERAVARFEAWLGLVGLAEHPSRKAWTSSLAANREATGFRGGASGEPVPFLWSYRIPFGGSPDLVPAFDALTSAEGAPEERASVGRVTFVGGEWIFGFALPTVSTHADVDGARVSLRVDADDRAGASTPLGSSSDKEEGLARVEALFARLGLDGPRFEGMQAGVLVC